MSDHSEETLPFAETQAPLGVEELDAKIPGLQVCEFIGKGGMGAVYRARQARLDRDVALKVLLPSAGDTDFHDRFETEARAMARLSHPNVVVVHDFGRAADIDYLVVEFIRGQTLRSVIAEGHVPPKTAYSITSQVCQALEYAHEEGVIHRDVKPENILIESRGRVRLADFGLARLVSSHRSDDHQVVGTPGYMAPEQFTNPAAVDHRADIYSTGAVIYEMLTREPFRHDSLPPSQRGFPDGRMDEVVSRALQKIPDERYQRARDIDDDVNQISRTDDSAVVLRKILPGSPEQVFRAWTERNQVEEFLAPSDEMTTDVTKLSAVVGEAFCLTMKDQTAHTARGEYCRVKHADTLSFTWAWDNEPIEPNETQVTIRFRPTESGTELVFIHERLSSPESCSSHQQGWEGVLQRLQIKLEQAAS